jgi:N-acetylneuraminate lyase|tara:strand:- start:450 stop:1355 length:906 start_codon:yes stop_codon:yes gene_type:complete
MIEKKLIAATYTPLKEDSSINLELIPTYSDFLQRNNVSGVFVNGTTGDFTSLTVDERKLIINEWATKRNENFTVINHVGHTSLKIAKELTIHSAEKVDGISALPPFYFKPRSLQSLLDYCKEIAACAPNLPFYYYHIPILTGANFSMIEFLELADEQIPNLGGIKFSNNDIIGLRQCYNFKAGKYAVFYGVDEMFLSSLPYGIKGWVGSTYNHLAPLYHKIYEAFNKGDISLASELQDKSVQFVQMLDALGGFNGVGKSFMKIVGIDCGPSRYPHTTLSNKDLLEVKTQFEELNIMSYTNK